MLRGDIVDQLHDDHGFSNAGSSEKPDFSAFPVRRKQIHDLDAGHQDLRFRVLVFKLRGLAVNRQPFAGLNVTTLVDGFAEDV